MTRRNLLILVVVAVLSLVCYVRVQKNPYVPVMAFAMNTIERYSLEPVSDLELFEGAMHGMLGPLDENSVYIPPEELGAFQEEIEGRFAGVGMQVVIDPDTKQLTVRSPLAGSPAYEAGVLAGDQILKIDGKSTEGMSLPEVVTLLHGPPETAVTLSILHWGEKSPVDIAIVREIVHEPTVLGDTRNEKGLWNYFLEDHPEIGYVRISKFTETTADELYDVLLWLKEQGMSGLVLDLRNDPGGWLEAANGVCNMLIHSGVIVTTRRRGGSQTYIADGKAPFTDFPIAVIVNQESASAAEIVAACLQDHDRAVIVGQRSYGKGTVQELIDFPRGCGAMKLTTASYWRPSGKNIQKPPEGSEDDQWGVTPHKGYKVVLTPEEYKQWQIWRASRDVYHPAGDKAAQDKSKPFVDRQLQRAVEYMEERMKDEG